MQLILQDKSNRAKHFFYDDLFATRPYKTASEKYWEFKEIIEEQRPHDCGTCYEFYDFIANPEKYNYFETACENIDWEDEEADEKWEALKDEFENWLNNEAQLKDIEFPSGKRDLFAFKEIEDEIEPYDFEAVGDYLDSQEQQEQE